MQKAADFFERLGVAYRVVGSLASMVYSEPRFTNDIDILADLQPEQAAPLVAEFPAPDFYVSLPAVREAIRDRTQFNIIHLPSGLNIDVILPRDTEFGRLDITRGQRLQSEGLYNAWFGAPENIILMKLRYYQESGGEKHLRDVASIVLIQADALDHDYLAHWATRLGVAAEWQLIRDRLPQSPR
jgi:hypothetical protein